MKIKPFPLHIDFATASSAQLDAAMQTLVDDLLCKDYAKWLHIDEISDDLLVLSFHDHPNVKDDIAYSYRMPREKVNEITRQYGAALQRLADNAACGIQIAAFQNLEKLRRILFKGADMTPKGNVFQLKGV